MNKNKKLIPELRFPEFGKDGEWTEKTISELGKTINGLTGKSGEDFGTGKPYVTYKQVFDNSIIDFQKCGKVEIGENENQNALQKGDILFTTSSETPNEVGFASVLIDSPKEDIYLNSFSFSLRPFDLEKTQPQFSRYLFHSPVYRKSVTVLVQGSTRFNISKVAFLNLKLPIPNPKEQQKIASCLSSLDEVITAHSQKLELLKDHKKGLMQNLFPQEGETAPKYRFKEFRKDGEWGALNLKDIGAIPKKNAVTKIDNQKLLTVKLHAKGIEFNDRNNPIISNTGRPYYERNVGEILIGRQNIHNGGIGIVTKEFDGHICSNAISSFKVNSNFSSSFILFYLQNPSNYQKIEDYMGGTGQKELSEKQFLEILIKLPKKIEEQQKIASCLSSLNEIITAQTEKIEQLRQHKKGLMQGLFPKINEI